MAQTDFTPGPDGAPSIKALGLDHFYNAEEWDSTYNTGDEYFIEEWVDDSCEEIVAVSTLVCGPTLFAAKIPTDIDEDGDTLDSELRFFATEDAAKAALARARGEVTP